MIRTYKSLIAAVLFVCVSQAASADQPFVEPGRENDVIKAQLAATDKSKPEITSEEGEKIYTNYLEATGKPVRPTSSMDQSKK